MKIQETKKTRKTRIHLYKDDLKRMLAMAKTGKTVKELAKEFNVTMLTVRRRCREMGFNIHKAYLDVREKRKELASQLLSEGKSVKEIADLIGTNQPMVLSWLHENQIRLRPKTPVETKNKLLDMVKNGSLVKEAAEATGINYDSACRICRKNGVSSANLKRRYNRGGKSQKYLEIIKLLKKGYSFDAIQKKTGVGYNYVCLLRERLLKLKKKEFEELRDDRINDLFIVMDELKKIHAICEENGIRCESKTVSEIFNKYNQLETEEETSNVRRG